MLNVCVLLRCVMLRRGFESIVVYRSLVGKSVLEAIYRAEELRRGVWTGRTFGWINENTVHCQYIQAFFGAFVSR